MQKLAKMMTAGVIGFASLAGLGCRDNSPPVAQIPPPAPGRETVRRDYEPEKPLPAPTTFDQGAPGPAPFQDEPLLIDTPPEAKPYVEAYRRVGRPRIMVFVNRTLDGTLIPAKPPEERVTRRITEKWGNGNDTRERNTVFLQKGQYDDLHARQIDFEMMELLLADWLSADNQVTIISTKDARKKLSDQQIKDLQSGRQQMLDDVADVLKADVLIQVQARATRETYNGLECRVIAEAINIKGGESLGRAAVDITPPLDKPQTNKFTRFLARKLMDNMTTAWGGFGPAPADAPKGPVRDDRKSENPTDH